MIDLIDQMIKERYITTRDHPSAGLEILNYTQIAQFHRKWNSATLLCRGLIRDKTTKKMVARPLRKFFNYAEVDPKQIPNLPFQVDDKMDGSFGILYWEDEKPETLPSIATRGSFDSDQARHATQLLRSKYAKELHRLRRELTYWFEIIYPENRIVVDYHGIDDLFLIGATNIETGDELKRSDPHLKELPFPHVKEFDGLNDLDQILKIQDPTNEGFVIRFEDGYRLKVKFEEYKRLHKVMTDISTHDIWNSLMEEKGFAEILEKVPDEFYNWVRKTQQDLETRFKQIEQEARDVISQVPTGSNRKEISAFFSKNYKHPHIVFAVYDNKPDWKRIVWKHIKPAFSKPFSEKEEV